jgi:hypothetical protein
MVRGILWITAGFNNFDINGTDEFTAPELKFFGNIPGTPEPGPVSAACSFVIALCFEAARRGRRRRAVVGR